MSSWGLRVRLPSHLVHPVRIDPAGICGPTRGQAAGPTWRRSSPGLYVPASVDATVVEQRIVEAAARVPEGGAVTGWAALRLHGAGYFDGLKADGKTHEPVELVLPAGSNIRPGAGVVRYRDHLAPAEVCTRAGVPVTRPERAAYDAARRAPDVRAAVVVLDMCLAAGVIDHRTFDNYLVGRPPGGRGVRQLQKALPLSDSRSMSPKETELRLIWLLDAGLPAPRCNWPVADGAGRFIGRPDLLSTELAVVGEFDGAGHPSRAQHREDLRRDDLFRAVGLEPFRVVGADLTDRHLVLGRIAQAIGRSKASTTPRSWSLQANPRPVS